MNITGKYLKAWKIEKKERFQLVDLGDSEKQQDGTYKNFTWYRCLFVSSAAQLQINEKDTIEVKSGIITMEKYNDKWSPKIVVFEAEVIVANNPDMKVTNTNVIYDGAGSFEDEIPF